MFFCKAVNSRGAICHVGLFLVCFCTHCSLEFQLTLLRNMLKPCRVAISLQFKGLLAYGSHIHALLKDGLSFIALASVSAITQMCALFFCVVVFCAITKKKKGCKASENCRWLQSPFPNSFAANARNRQFCMFACNLHCSQ